MPKPLLLIVDGEPLESPGLLAALESDGWEVRRLTHAEADAALRQGTLPDLLILDGGHHREPSGRLARSMRSLKSDLPLLVIEAAPDVASPFPVIVQGILDRQDTTQAWVAALRPFKPVPVKEKLDTEDIFGDILADLERPSAAAKAPAAVAVRKPVVAPPPPAVAVIPRATQPAPPAGGLMEAQEIFGGVLEDLDAVPTATRAKADQEFTLSGIPGVADPFDGGASDPSTRTTVAAPEAPAQEALSVGVAFPAAGTETGSSDYEEFGNYYLLEKIAVGGMAELFKAKQRGVHNFQKIVAIKRILPHLSDNDEFVTMFIDEAKLAAQLTHPNIVQIFDLGKASGAYYIAMEYVDGRDLRSLLRRVREYQLPFPEQVAAYIAVKVAQALDYAHRKRGMNDKELKLVHRDVSPQNIILSSEGAVKLVDFGIAKAATKTTQTMAGALKGKLLYMSPEQALGQPLDGRSDIYSLGLVLFELLTGERCFQADSELGVLEKVRLGRVADVRAFNPLVSNEMVAILNKVLAKSVEQRYASARLLERDLRDLLGHQGGEPTEHDVAEYENALLRGTKEQVEQIMGLRFKCQGRPQPLPAPPQSAARMMDDLPTAAEVRRPRAPQISQVPLPKLELGGSSRPLWVLPVVIFLAALVAVLIWVATHS
jgi:hypothetical protein